MYNSIRFLVPALCCALVFQSTVFAQKKSSADKYKPRTLADVVNLNKEGTDQTVNAAKLSEPRGYIAIDPYYSRVNLQYIGSPKLISPELQGFLKMWGKLQRADKKFIDLYEKVYLFKEGETEYWIPVGKEVAQDLDASVKTGDMINLFVIYIGAKKEANVKDFYSVFLATGSEK